APQANHGTQPGGRIQEANAEAIRLLHIPAAVVRGKSLFTHIAVTDRVLFREAVKQPTSADVPRYWVSQLKPRNQPSVIVAVSAVSMVDDDGRVVGASWILQDISGLKQVEAERRRTRHELDRRAQDRTVD